MKAAVGPPRDSLADRDPQRFEQAVTRILRAQGFSTSLRAFAYRSTLVLGTRDGCRIAVRDANWGTGIASVFTQDASAIGPVYYFYRGSRSARPPGLSVRLGRLEYEVGDRLGMRSPMHVVVALAAAPSCGNSAFGLSDLRLD